MARGKLVCCSCVYNKGRLPSCSCSSWVAVSCFSCNGSGKIESFLFLYMSDAEEFSIIVGINFFAARGLLRQETRRQV